MSPFNTNNVLIVSAVVALLAVVLGSAYVSGALDPVIEKIAVLVFKGEAKAEEKKLQAQGLKEGEDFLKGDLKGNKQADGVKEGLVTALLPTWEKTKSGGKKGFDTAWKWADKLGDPVNRLSNKIGSEAFWPTTLDRESDKAARILKSFCKDGFYVEEDRPTRIDGPKAKQKVIKKIPQKVIQNAVGLAIFTTMRTGLWISGAGGSGVLIARKEDGEWSPPSGILLHTAGLGFLVGVDIYDCVVVINNRKALDSFTKVRATLGGEISAVAGPVGIGGVLENDGKWKQANRPVFTYLKSRGFYAGVQFDGTVVIERTDENERFYGQKIGVADIIAGKARHPPYEIKMLMETVKAAEGRSDVDTQMMDQLANQTAPGDIEVTSPTSSETHTFGIPEPDDPDPFGVLALEKEGFEIREAGTKDRPQSSQFEYNPSPTSPTYNKFFRRSIDTFSNSNRESYLSTRSSRTRMSIDRGTQTMEMGTQTDGPMSPTTTPSQSSEHPRILEEKTPATELEEIDYTKIDLGPYNHHLNGSPDFDGTSMNGSPHDLSHESHESAESHDTSFVSEDEDEEEPIIFEAASAQATVLTPSAIKARGGLVNIPKRPPPPPLPPRNLARAKMVDQGSGRSPVKDSTDGFEEVDLKGRGSSDNAVEREVGITMHDLESHELDTHIPEVEKAEEEKLEKDVTVTDGARLTSPDNKDKNERTDPIEDSGISEINEEKAGEKEGAETTTEIHGNPEISQDDRSEATVEQQFAENTVERKLGKDDGNETEADDFHSLPVSPAPLEVEVK
ncbi:hypothetical protein B7494_g5312 [Chlorociboria aeruginascens]|nr:hypothetical protein B7494_g5312 [Chlorociboria aeruginascens]